MRTSERHCLATLLLLALTTSGCANSCNGCGESAPARPTTSLGATVPADMRAVLENAEELEIFATDPDPTPLQPGAPDTDDTLFHGHRIVGQARLDDAAQRAKLLEGVFSSIANSRNTIVACAEPRHGIRARRGDQVVDIQLSFRCLHGRMFLGDRRASILTSANGKSAVDAVFAKAGVPSGP